jgi:hypothetical protein
MPRATRILKPSFSGKDDENPYFHLNEFEQTCACLRIEGMSDGTLQWKLFPFSLTRRAKHWYKKTVGSMQGDWKALCSKFCLQFFPISRVVSLRSEVLTFKQEEQESLDTSWDHFNALIILALIFPFKTPFFFNTFIWVLIGKPRSTLI